MLFSDEKNVNIIYLRVLVKPGSKEQKIEIKDDELKIHLKASPRKGKANKELISFLAKMIGINKSDIELVKGHKSRDKVISLSSCSIEQVNKALNLEI